MLTPRTKPRPLGRLEGRDLGDELLFYSDRDDEFHVLNGTARDIFLLCDGSRSLEQIARSIADRYAVDLDTARRDATSTVESLVRIGLLVA